MIQTIESVKVGISNRARNNVVDRLTGDASGFLVDLIRRGRRRGACGRGGRFDTALVVDNDSSNRLLLTLLGSVGHERAYQARAAVCTATAIHPLVEACRSFLAVFVEREAEATKPFAAFTVG